MMGPVKQLIPKPSYESFNLEKRVPRRHLLRQIDECIDFAFVRGKVAHLYGAVGHESVDPIVLLKLMLLTYLEDVRSERALMETMPLRLDWMWFCRYDIDEAVPDHSVLSKARRRWGREAFVTFFLNILTQCQDAGLIGGQTVHADSSLIAADAARGVLVPDLRLHAQSLYDDLEAAAPPPPDAAPAGPPPLLPDAAAPSPSDPPPPNTPASAPLSLRAPFPFAAPPALPISPTLISPTDPDARWTRKNGQSVLGYKDHRIVDDRCGIITVTATTPVSVSDDSMLLPPPRRRALLRRRQHRIEGSFGDASQRHGFKRARWRRLVGMAIQNLLIATALNLRKLLRYGHRHGKAATLPPQTLPGPCWGSARRPWRPSTAWHSASGLPGTRPAPDRRPRRGSVPPRLWATAPGDPPAQVGAGDPPAQDVGAGDPRRRRAGRVKRPAACVPLVLRKVTMGNWQLETGNRFASRTIALPGPCVYPFRMGL